MASAGRILILVENLSVPFDRRVWLEATSLQKAGYTVSVICPKGRKCDTATCEEIEGVRIHRYDLPTCRLPFLSHVLEYAVAMAQTARLARRVFRGAGVDVIHACNPPDLFCLIAAPYRLRGVRFVFDQHDLSPETFRVQFDGRLMPVYWLLRALEKMTYRLSDAVIATNASVRAIARQRGPVPDERIFTVRTGPDFARLKRVPPDEALKGGRPHLVCYLGVMGKQDGVDYALRAAQRLLERRPGLARFAFIGDGDHAPALRTMARELGIQADVLFTGRVSDAELVRYLSTADVCLSPDPANGLNEFHTMNKTMDYMALGKPVVAFDLAETRTSADTAALYATPNDVGEFAAQIERLLDDPALREQLGQEGRRRVVEALAWEHSIPSLLAAYDTVLQHPIGVRQPVPGTGGPGTKRGRASASPQASDRP